jgi:predicted restriction endonuclease
MVTNDASWTRDTKSCTVVVKAAMNKQQKTLFTSKLDTKLRNKLVKCYIWRIALCGAGTLESRTEILGKF